MAEEQQVEHGLRMSGGGYQIRSTHPKVERVYPLVEWIEHNQRHGGRVFTRTIIVVEDWHEVPR